MAGGPYLGVHYADHALVLSRKRQLLVLAARVIELADQAQSFVLSHDHSQSSQALCRGLQRFGGGVDVVAAEDLASALLSR